ncbi:hypothetical protein ACIG5E_19830 [Kitasatospora sp. NPDC053057]|uniref:hypothetical protein n=1 Tax=Kitasatospora sp. NPDC053057 TaxID=3364062 RepID=UPI0037CB0768
MHPGAVAAGEQGGALGAGVGGDPLGPNTMVGTSSTAPTAPTASGEPVSSACTGGAVLAAALPALWRYDQRAHRPELVP